MLYIDNSYNATTIVEHRLRVMSSRELKGLDHKGDHYSDGLRNGKVRDGLPSQDAHPHSTTVIQGANLNSTTVAQGANQDVIHSVELSSIKEPDYAGDTSMNPQFLNSYMETPLPRSLEQDGCELGNSVASLGSPETTILSGGSGLLRISGVSEASVATVATGPRLSEEDFDNNVQSKYSSLATSVKEYGLQHVHVAGWKDTIDDDFLQLNEKIKVFRGWIGLFANTEYLRKAKELQNTLLQYKVKARSRLVVANSVRSNLKEKLDAEASSPDSSPPSAGNGENSVQGQNPTVDRSKQVSNSDEVFSSPAVEDPAEIFSLSTLLKQLDWDELQGFFDDPEVNQQKIEIIDAKIQTFVTQVSGSIKSNTDANAALQIRVESIERRIDKHAESIRDAKSTDSVIQSQIQIMNDNSSKLLVTVDEAKQKIALMETALIQHKVGQDGTVQSLKDSIEQVSSASSDTREIAEALSYTLRSQKQHLKHLVQKIDIIKGTPQTSIGSNITNVDSRPQSNINQIDGMELSTVSSISDPNVQVVYVSVPNSKGVTSQSTSRVSGFPGTAPGPSSRSTAEPNSARLSSAPDPITQLGSRNIYEEVSSGEDEPSTEKSVSGSRTTGMEVSQVTAPSKSADSLVSAPSVVGALPSVDPGKYLIEHNLRSLVSQMKGKTKVQISSQSPELLVKESKNHVVPAVEKIMNSCYSSLTKYVAYSSRDEDLYLQATSAIEKAEIWIQEVTDLYNDSEMYSMDASKSMAIIIERFTGQGSQTVYEFLDDFESMYRGKGTEKQKADKLYRDYLSERIRSLTNSIASDFVALKAWLIKEFGDLTTVTEALITMVEVTSKPSLKDYTGRAEYFLKLKSVLQKIQKLESQSGISKKELNRYIHSQLFMKRLVNLLPTDDEIEYAKILGRVGVDPRKISGVYAFQELVTYCSNEGCAMERAVGRVKSNKTTEKSKSKTAHVTSLSNSGMSSSEEDIPSVAFAGQKKKDFTKTPKSLPSKLWFNPKWRFPCPINDHDHELAHCTDFFSLTPAERKRLTGRKMCWTCLGPREKCMKRLKTGEIKYCCVNMQRVRPLVCIECTAYVKASPSLKCPFNIVMCGIPEHTKPSISEMSTLLKSYLPEMDMEKVSPILVYASSVASSPVCVTGAESKSSPVSNTEHDFVIDSSTGERSLLESDKCFQECNNPSVYITQWLQIGNSRCLCFFDTGASINMIDGKLAEREKIRVITQVPTTLKVVGGSKLVTDYGTYKLNLGPNDEGMYHKLTCHGMSSVAGPFPRHDLLKVNDEVMDHPQYSGSDTLPRYVGGSMVHLLIGIGNAAAQPVHLFTLESGISVYRSPFKDIFGSNICYGGSHDSFKGRSSSLNTNHSALFLNTMQDVKMSVFHATDDTVENHSTQFFQLLDYSDIKEEQMSSSECNSVQIDCELNINAFPTPLISKDFIYLGCSASEELDEDDSRQLHSTNHQSSKTKVLENSVGIPSVAKNAPDNIRQLDVSIPVPMNLPLPNWKVVYKKHVLLEEVVVHQRPRSSFEPFEQRSYRAPFFNHLWIQFPTSHRVGALGYVDEEILVDHVEHWVSGESTSGRRISRRGRKKSYKSRSDDKLATQEEVEEFVKVDPFNCYSPEWSLDDNLADLLES